MYGRTRLVAGLVICLAAAALMVADALSLEVGLVVGTIGFLMLAPHSRPTSRHSDQDKMT